MTTVVCAGCGTPIVERTLLGALDRFWHISCLNCSYCGLRLDELGQSVYVRCNLLLCKQDYLKIFGLSGTCARCRTQIPPEELVMRCQDKVYHLNCFACNRCNTHLQPGDKICSINGTLYCEHEFPHIFSITGPNITTNANNLVNNIKNTSTPVKWSNPSSRNQQPDVGVETIPHSNLDTMMMLSPTSTTSAISTTSIILNNGGIANVSLPRRSMSTATPQQLLMMTGNNNSTTQASAISDRLSIGGDMNLPSPTFYGSAILPPGMVTGPAANLAARSDTPITSMMSFDSAAPRTQPSPLCTSPPNVVFTPMLFTGSGVVDPSCGHSATICHQPSLDMGPGGMEMYTATPVTMTNCMLSTTLGVQPTLVSNKDSLANNANAATGVIAESAPTGGARKKQKKVDSRRCPPLRVC